MPAKTIRRRLTAWMRFVFAVHDVDRGRVFARAPRSITAVFGALAATLAVAGCSTAPQEDGLALMMDCMADRQDITEQADWSNVQPYRVRIVDGEFRPMILHLETDRPYVLELENADREAHDFWAPQFLKDGVALKSIQIDDKQPAEGCVNGVRLKPRSIVTLRFVPVWEGRYEVRNIAFALSPTIGADVVVNIVHPRVGISSN